MCCINEQSTASYSDSAFDYLSSIIIDTTPQHGRHFFDVNCQVCTGKIPDPLYDDDRKPSTATAVMHAPPGEETASAPESTGSSAPFVVDMSRDPRRSRQVQPASSASGAAVAVKMELVKPEPPPLPPLPPPLPPPPREPATTEPVKPEPPPTPKSPISIVPPPPPSDYQL